MAWVDLGSRNFWDWDLEIGEKKRVSAPGYVGALAMACRDMTVVGM
jgi:sugar lactone lactonase YvrE